MARQTRGVAVLEVGQPAPDFTLPDADDEPVALMEFRGRPVIVYFYPADDTPGCTKQACGIRDAWGEFEEAGAVVLGISPDTVESHARFRDKYGLPFSLLADPDRRVIERYGAWGMKEAYGRQYEGVIRSTVLVAPDGTVAAHWPKVRPSEHTDLVLDALHELDAA